MPPLRPRDLLRYIGANVQRLRLRQRLTQEQVVEETGLDLRHYRRIERGQENITIETLVALANALGVRPALLLRPAQPLPAKTGRPPGRRPSAAPR